MVEYRPIIRLKSGRAGVKKYRLSEVFHEMINNMPKNIGGLPRQYCPPQRPMADVLPRYDLPSYCSS